MTLFRIKMFVLTVIVTLATTGCSEPEMNSAPSSPDTSDVEVVQSVDLSEARARQLMENYTDAFEAAWAANDAKALAALYAEDAVRVSSAEQLPAYGRAAIEAVHAASFGAENADSILTTTTEIARFLSPTIVMAAGTYEAKDQDGKVSMRGLWSNAWRVEDEGLLMLLESAGDVVPGGMEADSLAAGQQVAEAYTGFGEELLNQGVDAYVINSNSGNFAGVADLFESDGIQVVSANERIVVGKSEILQALSSGAVPGVSLAAWGYGYQEISDGYAIGWGAYRQTDAEDRVVLFGHWGNIWSITDQGLMLVSERAGPYSGG